MLLFLLFTVLFATAVQASSRNHREAYLFDHETKWNCFYRSSSVVDGLNPSIWRKDQFGNLIMAGLNYNCAGALCYTFDHRFPISAVSDKPITLKSTALMSSIHNCQVLSYRTNLLKGSNEDTPHPFAQSLYGFDDETMRFFSANDYRVCRELEKLLLTEERREEIRKHYETYLNSNVFFDPMSVNRDSDDYFKKLFNLAELVSKNIKSLFKII